MQKAANAQRRDAETDAMALSRWITETPAGKAAYAEDRHLALTEACKVYRRGSQVAPSVESGRPTDDDDDPGAAADPMAAEERFDDDDDPEAASAPARAPPSSGSNCRRSGTTVSCSRAAAEIAGRSPRPRSTP